MSDDPISRARAVLEAATPGPWRRRVGDACTVVTLADGVAYPRFAETIDRADSRAVVLARNALPALLDVLEAVNEGHTRSCLFTGDNTGCVGCELGTRIDRALHVLEEEVGR